MPESYYDHLRHDYQRRRDILLPYLRRAGFTVYEPEGAYYVMTDIGALGGTDDTEFVRWMIRTVGVSAVPGSSFHAPRERGKTMVRFMFAKKDETLHAAGERLAKLRANIE
jgi:aminotransferase